MSQSRFVLKEYGQLNLHNHDIVTNTAGTLLVDDIFVGGTATTTIEFDGYESEGDLITSNPTPAIAVVKHFDGTKGTLSNTFLKYSEFYPTTGGKITTFDNNCGVEINANYSSLFSATNKLTIVETTSGTDGGVYISNSNNGGAAFNFSTDPASNSYGVQLFVDNRALVLTKDASILVSGHNSIILQDTTTGNSSISIGCNDTAGCLNVTNSYNFYNPPNYSAYITQAGSFTSTVSFPAPVSYGRITTQTASIAANTKSSFTVFNGPSLANFNNTYVNIPMIFANINTYVGTGNPVVQVNNINVTNGTFDLVISNISTTQALNSSMDIVFNVVYFQEFIN